MSSNRKDHFQFHRIDHFVTLSVKFFICLLFGSRVIPEKTSQHDKFRWLMGLMISCGTIQEMIVHRYCNVPYRRCTGTRNWRFSSDLTYQTALSGLVFSIDSLPLQAAFFRNTYTCTTDRSNKTLAAQITGLASSSSVFTYRTWSSHVVQLNQVFSLRQKLSVEPAARRSKGRLFHAIAAAVGNVRYSSAKGWLVVYPRHLQQASD
jgi:hypothetical protein